MRHLLRILHRSLSYLRLDKSVQIELLNWYDRDFDNPVPHHLKMRILSSGQIPDVWVETGTYMGQTTKFLAESGAFVFSVEPSPTLAKLAQKKFSGIGNIEIINQLSENAMYDVLTRVLIDQKESVSFWLDGHFSEGVTHLGPVETPIKRELEIISAFMDRFNRVDIYIDDFRCFVRQMPDYPSPHYLSSWAESHQASWDVQHDIFIIRKEAIL